MTTMLMYNGERVRTDCYIHVREVANCDLLQRSTTTQQYLYRRDREFNVLHDDVELWLATTDMCDRVKVYYANDDVYLVFEDPVECTLFKMAFNIT